MISAIAGGLSLLAAIAGIIGWYIKRKRAPTKAEQIDDIKIQFSDTIENVHRLRSSGKDDEAEAMLRRMRDNAGIARLLSDKHESS